MINKIKEHTLETQAEVLRDSYFIGMGFVLIWFMGIVFGRDFIYRVHSRFFELPATKFDQIHYSGMMITKMLIIVMFLIPYLAIRATLCNHHR